MAALKGAMQTLIQMIDDSFRGLNVDPPENLIEQLAIIVHDTMSAQSRSYHNLEHIFYFDTKDPISLLAALFHDIVYYQVDKGFHPELEPLIIPFIRQKDGDFFIKEGVAEEYGPVNILEDLFHFSPGEKLSTFNGLNEFLSAVVMAELLAGTLSQVDILKIATLIESTIPFRGLDADGHSHFDVLKRRLGKIRTKYNLDCSDDGIDQTLKLAVLFSNQDVKTFADPDVAKFLDITWKLLPESNDALRLRGSYTIQDYRKALQRMRGFLANLNPKDIFNQYLGTPPDDVFEQKEELARRNINTAVEYIRIKLVGMGILESLAESTGGDAPLALFTGDLPRDDGNSQPISVFLPDLPIPEHINPDQDDIYKLLKYGRFSEDSFDLKNSPLSLFIYSSSTSEEINQLDLISRDLFDKKLTPEDFLQLVPRHLVVAISTGCASTAITRRDRLLRIAARFSD